MDEEEASASASSPFAPRSSLVRTPPGVSGSPTKPVTTPVPLRPYTPAAPPAPPPPLPCKRPLTSPEERRPIDVVRMCRPATPSRAPLAGATLATTLTPAELTLSPSASPEVGLSQPPTQTQLEPAAEQQGKELHPLSAATKEELFERVHLDLQKVMASVTSQSSRLNKENVNLIGASVHDALAVVATLSLRLSEAELRLAQAHLELKTKDHEVLKARSEAAVATVSGKTTIPGAHTSYSEVLRLPRKAEPVPIPATSGPVLAFYPAPDQTNKLKTAEDTKAELKRTIRPQDLDLQVDRVRKVGNAGVVVQTSTPSAAQRLRSAAPPTLRVSEPVKRQPRLCLRNFSIAIISATGV